MHTKLKSWGKLNQSAVCNCETVKNLGIGEWIKNRKEAKADCCMEVEKNGLVNLKRGQDYFYQVQCQLECAQLDTCFFMIFTQKDFYIEKIDRDPGFWTDKIFPKLKGFFMDALIPEFHGGFQYESRTYKINRLVPVTGKFIFLTFYPSLYLHT